MSQPDEFERRLGVALRKTVPDAPSVPDRADRAEQRGRRRRRRMTMGAAAAAAVAVGVVTVGAALPRLGGESAPTPTPPNQTETLECPLARSDPRGTELTPRQSPPLGPGFVAARICPGQQGMANVDLPQDVVRTDLTVLARAIDGAPERRDSPGSFCSADLGVGWSLRLGYDDGTERTIDGANFGCRLLVGAGPTRSNPAQVYDVFLDLVRRQRRTEQSPGVSDEALRCGNETSPLARAVDVERARLCWRAWDAPKSPWSSAVLTREQVDRIRTDLGDPANRAEADYRNCPEDHLTFKLVGETAWRDVTTISGECGIFNTTNHSSGVRRLTPAVQALLDRLTR